MAGIPRSRLAAALAAALVAAAPASALPPRLAAVHSWAFAIGTGDLSGSVVARFAAYDLVVVDGEEATARQVRALRSTGKVVLGYLDVGTVEPGRGWYAAARRYRLDYWPDWGEWYANVDAAGYRSLLAGKVAPALLAKGFDGLFLDNVDMLETHPAQRPGMVALVRALARRVHARGGYLFAQNGEDVLGPLLPLLDGWNREDVSATYDFTTKRYVAVQPADSAAATDALRALRRRGLLTLATDYVAAGDAAGAARAVATACAAGALPFVSDIDLTRIPATPARCP